MNKSEILERLNLGNSVAENDDNLESYFVPTVALDDFLADRFDLVRGAKGSGKSAILKMVSRPGYYSQLQDVELLVATEHTGEPAFKRAFETILLDKVSDGALVNAWKAYIINLALDAAEQLPASAERTAAVGFAESCGLRFKSANAFKKMWWSLLRFVHIKSINVGAEGIAAEFPDNPPDIWMQKEQVIDFPEALRLIVRAFESAGKRCWILMDRLDAVFQTQAELERRALRSLLIAYKDFMGQRALRLKLFFRTDLYDTVTADSEGFRELTHVADRASAPIAWDPDKLLHLLMERFAFNAPVCSRYGFEKADVADSVLRTAAFFTIFPQQIAVGKGKGDSWAWICNRIRDGNNTRTPRDLNTLVIKAAQKERELLGLGRGIESDELISGAAVKAGLEDLSKDKVRTTLIAENPDLADAIRKFQGQKAEQNAETLASLYGQEWSDTVDHLVRIGFIEKLPESWKIPILYRDGLDIIQGAAFPKPKAKPDDDE